MDCTFASDNTSGVHPKVMEALNKANVGAAEPYGDDPWTAEAEGCCAATWPTRTPRKAGRSRPSWAAR